MLSFAKLPYPSYHTMRRSDGASNAVELVPKSLDVVQTINNDDIILGQEPFDSRHEGASRLLFIRSRFVRDMLVEVERFIVDNVNAIVLGLGRFILRLRCKTGFKELLEFYGPPALS